MHITSPELCHRHNINPMMFTRCREFFVKSGKAALSEKVKDNAVKILIKENESLTKLIGNFTMANYALKKR